MDGVELATFGTKYYYATLYFGTHNQPMSLLLDTANSLTWVSGLEC